jgi:hypothetical protein
MTIFVILWRKVIKTMRFCQEMICFLAKSCVCVRDLAEKYNTSAL